MKNIRRNHSLHLVLLKSIHSTKGQLAVHMIEPALLVVLVFLIPWFSVESTLPWQKIWGRPTGWSDKYQIAQKIEQQESLPISARFEGAEIRSFTPKEIGAQYDIERLYRSLVPESDYPFSRLRTSLQEVRDVPLATNEERLNLFLDELSTKIAITAQNASFSMEEGKVKLNQHTDGRELDREVTKSAVLAAVREARSEVQVTSKKLPASLTAEMLQTQYNLLSSAIAEDTVTVRINSTDYSLPMLELVSYIDSTQLGSGTITFKKDELINYLQATLTPKVAVAVRNTVVRQVDSTVIGTQEGAQGTTLDEARLAADMLAALSEGRTVVEGYLVAVNPQTVLERTYTKSAIGLQLLLQDWDEQQGGDWGVYIASISNPELKAGLNEGKQFVAASLYKLFLAEQVLKRIDSGVINKDASTPYGMSVYQCIDAMIVVSSNTCPLYLFDLVGYQTVQAEVEASGYASTVLYNPSGSLLTTAKDSHALLSKLQAGATLSAASREYVLTLMGKQIYRSGIPKGSVPAPVQDKVGALYGNHHDIGIVYTNEPYILAVLSNNASTAKIRELSQRIYQVMSK